ncbi:zinc finger and BTB domain-containing protein 41-like [Condylostylus longicornis]|uniref:zinc finger and BTB domain-containing protein 41-like n=1 Tax=Condylostylus longicornis TaxID=2530218 RepID=UPI00244E0570|nr:zinc finger and BTB domain-containing protein 41-like [Condylostylus longicornis]
MGKNSEKNMSMAPSKNNVAGKLRSERTKKLMMKCQKCHLKFSSQKKFIQHLREHANSRNRYGKSTQCDSCSMVFPTQTKAIQHKHRAHPDIPNSFCQFCGKLFVLKNSLDEHLAKEHANQMSQSCNLIKCDHCSATFSNAVALQYHVKSLHQQINYLLANDLYIPPSSTKIIRSNSSELFSAYYCHLCGVEYMIKNSLKKHLYEIHQPEERNKKPDDLIKCRTCEAIFFTKLAYEKHLVFHKPNDFYAANQEARMKVVSRVDQDFDISRVPLLQEINIMMKQMTESNMLPQNGLGTPNILTNPIKIEPDDSNVGLEPSFQNKSLDIIPIQSVKVEKFNVSEKFLPSGAFDKTDYDQNQSQTNKLILTKNTELENKKIQEKNKISTLNRKIFQTKKISSETKPPIITKSNSKNPSPTDSGASFKEIDKTSKACTIVSNKLENKIVIKSRTDATMEIVDSQNKVILLKKVVLKKKPKVKVKMENQ